MLLRASAESRQAARPSEPKAPRWFLGFLNADDWKTRVAAIERNIETAMQPGTRAFHAEDTHPPTADATAWRGTSTWWTPRCVIR